MSLAELVRDVANLRASRDRFAADLRRREEKFQEENACLIDDIALRKEELAKAEEHLRAAVLAAPEEEVKSTFGVGIRNATEFSYEERMAIEWAIWENAAGVLKLNHSKFETAMRGEVTKGTIPGFVKVMTMKKATIARDLSEVLRRAEHGRD